MPYVQTTTVTRPFIPCCCCLFSSLQCVRLTGALLGLVVLALGIYLLVTLSLNPRNALNAVYQIIFGGLMVIAEARWTRFLRFFYFMQHFLGLGLFYIFVGGLSLGGEWYEYVVAGVCFALGLIYFTLGLGCRRMGRENFKRSGVDNAMPLDGVSTQSAAAPAAAAAAEKDVSGPSYGGNSYAAEPAAIRDAKANASAYGNQSAYSNDNAYSNDSPRSPPTYGGNNHQSAYSNDPEVA